jgi:sugar O-acyltransferase (sialic acid O-acetyltransferase NeuD family)
MNLIIIGASGLAREVFDLAYMCYGYLPNFVVKGFLSDGPSNINDLGYPPVLAKVDDYEVQQDDRFFCAIGNVDDRKKTVEIIQSKGGEFINLIHPKAIMSPSAKIGIGIAIKAYSSVASDTFIGDFTYLQSSVILGHDVKIGKYCHLNSFSFLAGCVEVEDQVIINAGAKILQSKKIRNHSIVGMGSIVIRNVKPYTTVFGNPAKKIN